MSLSPRSGPNPIRPPAFGLAVPFDDRPERFAAKVGATYAVLVAANVAAWAWAWTAFADRPTLLGTALLAWVFGLRHAVDADHIAAIDCPGLTRPSTRRLTISTEAMTMAMARM